VRLVVNAIAHWRYKSIPIPKKPTYHPRDITVIIPTINIDSEKLRRTTESILACNPSQIILVTQNSEYATLQLFASSIKIDKIKIFKAQIANKRRQLCQAIPQVKTRIVVLVDDDVMWPSEILPWLLAPFEDPRIGGVGTCQRVRRLGTGLFGEKCWNFVSMAYIERRNFEISATHWIDGGTSCMSGRTLAVRTKIFSRDFLLSFEGERWGKNLLNADDDNFVTRWLFENGWKTWIQYNEYCEIETTFENDSRFLKRCFRWARSNWRSNLKTLIQGIWRRVNALASE
jgi:cellulose synthase/poly-beta-1,6-N-acetylglucosamine synthase-like glycosyltransferase